MNTTKIEVPIAMRWKTSIEMILFQFINQRPLCRSFNTFPEMDHIIKCVLFIEKTKNKEIQLGLAMSTKPPFITKAIFKISILSANISIEMNTNYEGDQMHGKTICSFKEFFDPANNYFVDDELIIRIEGILSCEKEQQKCDDFKIENSKNLGEYLWDRDDKDYEFHVDKNIIKVHKCVIGAKSTVFDRMIKSGMKESAENKVTITDFGYDIVEIAIKYLYGLQIEKSITVANGIKLLQFSDKYDILDLKELMEEYLFKNKSRMNICKIVNASIISNSIKLQERCFNFLLECMKLSIFIKNLEILDKEFSLDLLKASFSQ